MQAAEGNLAMTMLQRLAGATMVASTILFSGPAPAAQFDGITVRLGTFGGKWRDIVAEHVVKAFEKEGGKIEFVLGQPSTNLAKLIAARGREAPFDVLETMDNNLPTLTEGKFLEPLNLDKIPNVRQLDKANYDTNKVMIWITQEGIVYNKKALADNGIPVPTRYQDLADPTFKGKVALPDITAGGAMPAIVGMAYESGGSETNIDPALDLVRKIAPASFWSSSSNLQTMLVNGDVWAAGAQAGNVQRLRGKADLGMVFPAVNGKHGVLKQGYLVKVKGTKHPEAVEWIINTFLAKSMQVATFAEGGQVPVSAEALADVRQGGTYDFLRLKPEEIAGMYRIDFSKVDEPAYVQKWNRRISR
jgi:putative spermidine/putrescine transport system substrate-binding protein